MPGADAGVVVVLNGASSAGKSTVAAAVRGLWRRPLQVSGIDTFLACQAESFFGVDGVEAPGFSWRPTIVEGLPAYLIQPGPLGQGLVRAAHRYWRACADEGLDQVIDHVLLEPDWFADLTQVLAGLAVIWVGIRCPLDVLEQRERDRGDRMVGQGRGHAHLIHQWPTYDVEIDTSVGTPQAAASTIVHAVRQLALLRSASDRSLSTDQDVH